MKIKIITLLLFFALKTYAQQGQGSVILVTSSQETNLGTFATLADINPPKIRVLKGLWNDRYEIGDKTTAKGKVALHLKEHSSDAYILWRGADKAENKAVVWSIVGLLGTITGAFSENGDSQLLGYGVAALGFSVSLGCIVIGNNKRGKSIKTYNKRFGYE